MQLYLFDREPTKDVVLLPDQRKGKQLWFRWKDDWVRQEWCGKFPDGTPRAPWYDAKFIDLWNTKGPEVAQDKSNYDLSYLTDYEDLTEVA